MANRNREYHPRRVQDHTGMVFKAIMSRQNESESSWIKVFRGNPVAYHCPECNGVEGFRLLVDDDPDSGIIMILCKCKAYTRPLEIRAPQMNDAIAKHLGLYVPGSYIEFDVDVREE